MRRFALGMVAFAALGLALGGCKKKQADKKVEGATAGAGLKTAAPTTKTPAADPAAIVDRAIKAHGGLAALKSKLAKMEIRAKGNYHGMPFSSVSYFDLPGKSAMTILSAKMSWGSDGKKCWSKMGKVVMDCRPAQVQEMTNQRRVGYLATLYPLKDPAVKLEAAPARKDGKALSGVRATWGPTTVTFWFDSKTGMLSEFEWNGKWNEMAGKLTSEVSALKTQDGVSWPSKSKMYFNGKLVLEEEVTGMKLGQVDASKLARPAQAPLDEPVVKKVPRHFAAYLVHKGKRSEMKKAFMSFHRWMMSSKIVALSPIPSLHFLKRGKDGAPGVTELRTMVVQPEVAVKPGADRGVKEVAEHQIVWVLHQGSYKKAGEQYKKLGAWATKSGWKVAGPPAMVPYSVPGQTPPEKMLAVYLLPVAK